MKKALKIFLNILLIGLGLSIVLPVILSLVLSLNSVQNYIVDKAAKYATEFLGTPVKIGHIQINSLKSYEVNEIYVQDSMFQDTLIYLKNASVEISGFGITNPGLVFNSIVATKGNFHLNQYADSTTNIKYILQKIKGNKPKKENKTNIKFNSIVIDSLNFRYRKYIKQGAEYGIDFTNLYLNNISGRVNNLHVDKTEITMNVEKLSCKENDNITLKNLSANNVYLSPDSMRFKKININIDNSNIDLHHFAMFYSNWRMDDFINRVPMDINVKNAHIDFRDVAKFTRQKRKWQTQVDFSLTFYGTVNDFSGKINHINTIKTSIENTQYRITGIPDTKKMFFDFNIGTINTNINNIYEILNDFSNKKTLEFTKDIDYEPNIIANGSFKGYLDNFTTSLSLRPTDEKGSGNVFLKFFNKNKVLKFDGNVKTNNLNIGKILNNKNLGRLSSTVKANGSIQNKIAIISANGLIDSVNLNNLDLQNISFNSTIKDKIVDAAVFCKDDKINLDFNGTLNFTEKTPSYNAYLDIIKADLFDLNIIKHDSVSHLSTRMMLNGKSFDINNLLLNAKVDKLLIYNSKDTLRSKSSIDVKINNNDKIKNITFNSEFADVKLRGVSNFGQIPDYIRESIQTYFPVFSKNKQTYTIDTTAKRFESSYVIQFNLKKQTKLIQQLVPDLEIAENSKLLFMFNPSKKTYSLNANIPFIAYKNNMASNLIISSMNKADSMTLYLSAYELLYSNLYVPNISVVGDVSNDKLSASVGFHNNQNQSRLFLKANGQFYREENSKVSLNANILPSYYTLKDRQWDMLGGKFDISGGDINIDSLRIVSDKEEFIANGILSKGEEDILTVNFKNFDISPLSVLLRKIGFKLTGNGNGIISLKAGLDKYKREINGELDINNLSVNTAKLEESKLVVQWNKDRKLNELILIGKKSNKKLVDGYLSWLDNKYNFDFRFSNLNPVVISPFLTNIASDINGSADINLNISNKNKYNKAILNGEAIINKLSTRIDFTKATYNTSGYMTIKENLFEMKNTMITDSLGGSGNMDMTLNIDPVKGFMYNINIKPQNMLALNTTQRDNPMFYGKVYASGDLTIKNGANNSVDFRGDVSTAKQSKFFLPLSHNQSISDANFIKYVTRNNSDSTRNILWNIYKKKNSVKSSGGINLRLNMNVLENTEIEIVIDPVSGSTIKSTGNGSMLMNVKSNENLFTINGEYTIKDGTYKFIMPNINLINKIFTIKEGGWIRFSGDPLDAILNVDAIYKVKASLAPLITGQSDKNSFMSRVNVDCRMKIKDKLMKPTIELNVDVLNNDPEAMAIVQSVMNTPEEVSNQFIFLLLSNSFMSLNGNSNGSNIGLMSGVVTGIEFLTSRIKEIISSDKFDFNINYLPKSDVTSDEFSLGISAPLYKDKLLLEVTGNYNFMNNKDAIASDNMSKLSAEAYLTWKINETGNLQLKGFTRTIDTFDENQGLQESGVGIYYKEEFNNFKELVEMYRSRARIRKAKRAEKKELKRQRDSIKNSRKINTIKIDTLRN